MLIKRATSDEKNNHNNDDRYVIITKTITESNSSLSKVEWLHEN